VIVVGAVTWRALASVRGRAAPSAIGHAPPG
jgi:hypothetical protein